MKTIKKMLAPLLLLIVTMTMINIVPVSAASSTVAKIGSKKYTSLDDAIAVVKNGQTIKLQKNVTYAKKLTVNRSKVKFTLDLNGNTITFDGDSAYLYLKKGTMTLKGGTISGENWDQDGSCMIIKVAKGKALTISSGTFTGTIENKGTLKIDGGKFEFPEFFSYRHPQWGNSGTLNINGGTFNYFYLRNTGKASISDGTFKRVTISSEKTLKISGGTFKETTTSEGYSMITSSGKEAKCTITGGTYKVTDGAPPIFNNASSSTMVIKTAKMSFSNSRSQGYVHPIMNNNAKLTIEGGTFTSTKNLVTSHGKSASVKITGGTFKATGSSKYVMLTSYDGSKITVSGGTFKADKAYAYAQKIENNNSSGTVKIKGGNFKSVKNNKKRKYAINFEP